MTVENRKSETCATCGAAISAAQAGLSRARADYAPARCADCITGELTREMERLAHAHMTVQDRQPDPVDPRCLTFARLFLDDCDLPTIAHQYALAELIQHTLQDYLADHTDPYADPPLGSKYWPSL
jgi:hypothetical protein